MKNIEDFLASRTVVFTRDGHPVYESADSGIKPLVAAIDSGVDYSGCDAADRIVGKAAAMLYALLRVKSVSACVMTHKAKEILTANGIAREADAYADAIVNRKGDGLCPMETAVKDITEPNAALGAIRNKIEQLRSGAAQ